MIRDFTMTIKILAIGDTANVITDLKKYASNMEITLIDFKERAKTLIKDEDTEILGKYSLFRHLKKINSIKSKYDLVLVMGWTAAKLAYLSGTRYIIYFVGNDIRNPPFGGFEKSELALVPKDKLNLIEKKFYRSVLKNASACITTGPELFAILKKYRNDAYRIDHILFDKNLFEVSNTPLNRPKTKFTFFSPQRISYQKGYDILWKALPLCKSDFEVLQVEWFDYQLENKKREILAKKPSQIKIIPLIPRNEMIKFYNYCDAVIGNLRLGYLEGIGREGVMCKKPVLNYINSEYSWILDEKETIPPFVPQTKDPKEIALIIDRIVEDQEFREELVKKQFEFVQIYTDPQRTIESWEEFLKNMLRDKNKVKNSFLSLKLIYYLVGRGLRKITTFMRI